MTPEKQLATDTNYAQVRLNELLELHGTDRVLEWVERGQYAEQLSTKLVRPFVDQQTDLHLGTAGEVKIRNWWSDISRGDCEAVLPKALEYSSQDLLAIGTGLPGVTADDQVRTEAGIAFYALGKCARLTGAYGEGRVPSDDNWRDLTIYSLMARFVRQFGHWGVTK